MLRTSSHSITDEDSRSNSNLFEDALQMQISSGVFSGHGVVTSIAPTQCTATVTPTYTPTVHFFVEQTSRKLLGWWYSDAIRQEQKETTLYVRRVFSIKPQITPALPSQLRRCFAKAMSEYSRVQQAGRVASAASSLPEIQEEEEDEYQPMDEGLQVDHTMEDDDIASSRKRKLCDVNLFDENANPVVGVCVPETRTVSPSSISPTVTDESVSFLDAPKVKVAMDTSSSHALNDTCIEYEKAKEMKATLHRIVDPKHTYGSHPLLTGPRDLSESIDSVVQRYMKWLKGDARYISEASRIDGFFSMVYLIGNAMAISRVLPNVLKTKLEEDTTSIPVSRFFLFCRNAENLLTWWLEAETTKCANTLTINEDPIFVLLKMMQRNLKAKHKDGSIHITFEKVVDATRRCGLPMEMAIDHIRQRSCVLRGGNVTATFVHGYEPLPFIVRDALGVHYTVYHTDKERFSWKESVVSYIAQKMHALVHKIAEQATSSIEPSLRHMSSERFQSTIMHFCVIDVLEATNIDLFASRMSKIVFSSDEAEGVAKDLGVAMPQHLRSKRLVPLCLLSSYDLLFQQKTWLKDTYPDPDNKKRMLYRRAFYWFLSAIFSEDTLVDTMYEHSKSCKGCGSGRKEISNIVAAGKLNDKKFAMSNGCENTIKYRRCPVDQGDVNEMHTKLRCLSVMGVPQTKLQDTSVKKTVAMIDSPGSLTVYAMQLRAKKDEETVDMDEDA